MHPRQLALIDDAVGAIAAECLRSPVATLNAGHLRAVLVEHLLRAGATLVERGAKADERRLLRLVDEVVQVERTSAPRAEQRGRPPRAPDLRVGAPVVLGVDVWARSAMAPIDRLGPRMLHDRLAALADGTSDLLLIACDRRAYDGLRIERASADGAPSALPRLCATLLPASASLGEAPSRGAPMLSGRRWGTLATLTPMVYGSQRVVAALWAGSRQPALVGAAPQLDAFD